MDMQGIRIRQLRLQDYRFGNEDHFDKESRAAPIASSGMRPFRPKRQTSQRSSATLVALAAALSLVSITFIACAERSALWHVVHDLCVVDQRNNGSPAPCEHVDLADGERNGYAILKDLIGTTQYLLIATRPISGIESPDLLAPDAPNYWRAAWQARTYVSRQAKIELPREAVGMAINSASARTQDQLHIHIDCVRPDVRDGISGHAAAFRETWTALPFELDGRDYVARRVDSPDLDGVDPFRLLAEGVEAARHDMAAETLVVIGATFDDGRPGFVLLADHADPTRDDPAHGEDLLDHTCSIAHSSAGGHINS
jgi:CDP-diacylglycerol pyrophosphatase